ncbi:hypothetical protein C8J57DRAFT_1211474 [Mycena rebaudengoi]|nr:hypothetical protein C8J57DRAFT_1211474 [Mycena rebaudengoi]
MLPSAGDHFCAKKPTEVTRTKLANRAGGGCIDSSAAGTTTAASVTLEARPSRLLVADFDDINHHAVFPKKKVDTGMYQLRQLNVHGEGRTMTRKDEGRKTQADKAPGLLCGRGEAGEGRVGESGAAVAASTGAGSTGTAGASGSTGAGSASTGTTGSASSKAKSAAKSKLGKMGPPAGPYSGSAGGATGANKGTGSSANTNSDLAPCGRVVDGDKDLVGCVVDGHAYFFYGDAYFFYGDAHFIDGDSHYVVCRRLLDRRGRARSRRVARHAGERVVCRVQGAPDVKAAGAHCELAGEDERWGAGGDHERGLAGAAVCRRRGRGGAAQEAAAGAQAAHLALARHSEARVAARRVGVIRGVCGVGQQRATQEPRRRGARALEHGREGAAREHGRDEEWGWGWGGWAGSGGRRGVRGRASIMQGGGAAVRGGCGCGW